MNITIYQKVSSFNTIFWREIEIECRGAGTKEDPVIIEPSREIPKNSYLRDYNFFIHVKNLHQKYLSLTRCQNITLKDCQLKYCHVLNCSDIRIENLSITKLLRIYSSKDVYIQDSIIGKLKLNQSNSNTFKNCSFKQVNKTLSPDNVFESNTVSGKQVTEVKQRRVIDFINKWELINGI
jgi:hypothetical protein